MIYHSWTKTVYVGSLVLLTRFTRAGWCHSQRNQAGGLWLAERGSASFGVCIKQVGAPAWQWFLKWKWDDICHPRIVFQWCNEPATSYMQHVAACSLLLHRCKRFAIHVPLASSECGFFQPSFASGWSWIRWTFQGMPSREPAKRWQRWWKHRCWRMDQQCHSRNTGRWVKNSRCEVKENESNQMLGRMSFWQKLRQLTHKVLLL